MRVTFVLPSPARVPMGGVKVVVEYARRLVERGHQVSVVGPQRPGDGPRDRAFGLAVAARDRLHRVPDRPYFDAPGVDVRIIPSPSARHVPNADVVIATGWQTAAWVAELPASKGRKGYFIQNHEDYLDPRALGTWELPLAIFTCARWLADAVEAAGHPTLGHLPNAIDPDEFGLDRPIADRDPRILWLYHRLPSKGPAEGLETLRSVLAQRPEVEVDVFAARPPSHRFPDGVSVHVRPERATLRELYNRAAVFLHPSHIEGWPLPPMEAMACGAAVVAAANDGVREYLDPTCGRLAPVGDASALAQATLDVLASERDRVTLAESARQRVSTYSWASSTDRLVEILEAILSGEAQR